ncbi:dynactin subunit 4 [Onthophagus taurus]|uniref:dynactin subunit 4 n=1 Tax=Onthophagus taurus TaxID=166361 RepID=UPI0039BE2CB1
MAYIVEPEVVKYACTCGLLKPISKLYFCRHCLEVRCGYCLCHEVDCHFCDKCLEIMTSTEARIRKNRCGTCLLCPSCTLHLTVRAVVVPGDNPKSTPKKSLYLSCLTCRWSSRDVGIPDQPISTRDWPERENVHSVRLVKILEYYRGVVQKEQQQKLEKDKKKPPRFMSYTDRTGITAAMMRKHLGIPDPNVGIKKKSEEEMIGATPKEVIEDYPEHLFTEEIDLTKLTSIKQCLLQPESQPSTVDKLFPVHKHCSVKQSLRCRSCEHNVSKPEFNPTSVRFKIQLFAYYHIPEVRIVTVEPLRAGKPCELFLKFINPTQHQTTISILPLSAMEIKSPENNSNLVMVKTEEKEPISLPSSQPSSIIQSSLSRQPSITIKSRPVDSKIGGDLEIPSQSFILPPRDDAAEYDDSGENYNFQDDPKLVIRRKSNKAVIKLIITPSDELKLGEEVIIGFVMQHVYTNTIPIEKVKEPQKCEHKISVYLSLGNLVGSQ